MRRRQACHQRRTWFLSEWQDANWLRLWGKRENRQIGLHTVWFPFGSLWCKLRCFLALLPAMVSSRCLWTHCLFQLDSLLTSYHNVPRLQTLRVVEWGETWGTFYVTTTTSKQPSWCPSTCSHPGWWLQHYCMRPHPSLNMAFCVSSHSMRCLQGHKAGGAMTFSSSFLLDVAHLQSQPPFWDQLHTPT